MQVTINLDTVNDFDVIIEVISAARNKFIDFASEVKISSDPAEIQLWNETQRKIEALTNFEQQIFDAI